MKYKGISRERCDFEEVGEEMKNFANEYNKLPAIFAIKLYVINLSVFSPTNYQIQLPLLSPNSDF